MNANLAETQYNLSKWHEIIKECSSSNLGIIQWLKENNISKDQYYYWKKKLKDMCLESLQPAFVELPAPSQSKKSDMVISNTTVNETDKVSAATIRYNGPMSIHWTQKVESFYAASIASSSIC